MTEQGATGSIVYRDLRVDEAPLFANVDRSEQIDSIYRASNGVLELHEMRHEAQPWGVAELVTYVARLRALIDSGGSAIAAWDGQSLVGIGSLDVSGVGGDCTVMALDMLHVSAAYRGRGIGRALTEMVANRARSLGARALYISATPTRRTVEVYLHMGATVLGAPDPESLAREPEDIHLSIRLV